MTIKRPFIKTPRRWWMAIRKRLSPDLAPEYSQSKISPYHTTEAPSPVLQELQRFDEILGDSIKASAPVHNTNDSI